VHDGWRTDFWEDLVAVAHMRCHAAKVKEVRQNRAGRQMKVDGACHCGRISFEAEINPDQIGVCHCTDCQTLTGSAFRANIQARAESFVRRGIAPKVYIKTAESGAKRAHAFCPACGTPLYATAAEGAPTSYSLRVGTIKQRHELGKPALQLWCDSALPWSMQMADVPKRARQ
jgi:hypothetical protein